MRRLLLLLHTASMHHCAAWSRYVLLPSGCLSICASNHLAHPSTVLDPRQAVEGGAARKAYDLQLPALGPYSLSFTRSGRHMLLAGRKGHLALMDWQRHRLVCEVQVRVGEGRRRLAAGNRAVQRGRQQSAQAAEAMPAAAT